MAMKLHGRRDNRRGNQQASRRTADRWKIDKAAAHQWNICALPG